MPSQSMRTKSAGVLGASAKLPPLERDVPGGGAAGGRDGGGRGGGVMGGFRNGSIGMRLVTSAPTPVESFLPTAPAAAAAAAAKLPIMVSKGNGLACSADRVPDQSTDRSAARSTDRSVVDRISTEVIFDDPYTAADLSSSPASALVARAGVTGSPGQEGMLRRRANLAPIRANMYSPSTRSSGMHPTSTQASSVYSASAQASGMYSASTQASGMYAASTQPSGVLAVAAATASPAVSAAGTDDRASIARSTGGGGERSGGARGAGGVGDGGFPSRSKSTTSPLSAWGSARALFPEGTDGRIFSGIRRERVRVVGSGGDVARGSGDNGCRGASGLSGQAPTSAAASDAVAAADSLHCSSSTIGRSG